MSVSVVSASAPVSPPAMSEVEVSEAGSPEVKDEGTRLPQPTLLAALPPGQGTRVDQIA